MLEVMCSKPSKSLDPCQKHRSMLYGSFFVESSFYTYIFLSFISSSLDFMIETFSYFTFILHGNRLIYLKFHTLLYTLGNIHILKTGL